MSVDADYTSWQRKIRQPVLRHLTALTALSCTGEGLFAVQADEVRKAGCCDRLGNEGPLCRLTPSCPLQPQDTRLCPCACCTPHAMRYSLLLEYVECVLALYPSLVLALPLCAGAAAQPGAACGH